MKKIFYIFLFVCVIGGVVVGGKIKEVGSSNQHVLSAQSTRESDRVQTVSAKVEKSAEQGEIATIPLLLSIPKINVHATVESVGMDARGRMDVPKKDNNVAWYNLGYKPGQKGSAVIAGHFDKADGSPSIFFSLAKLTVGDMIETTDANDKQLRFTVVRITNYPDDTFPLQKVFGPSDKQMLNLITCQGTWNKTTKNYSQRTVVFAELIK